MLVEKLSAKAPGGPTKLKILTAIAEENNIKWDPKSFGERESNPQEDLLNGPNSSETASEMHLSSSNVQAPYHGRLSPDIHISTDNEAKQEAPINYDGYGDRSAFGSQTKTPTCISAAPTPTLKPSGNGIDRMESGNLYSEDQSSEQNWNMEFKDATSAAQAAAEAAERASMAARAAAELSTRSKISNQNSTGSESSSAYASRDAKDGTSIRHSGSSFDNEAFARGQMSNTLEERSSRQQNGEISAKEWHDFMEQGEKFHGDVNKGNDRPSEIPSAASTVDSSKDNNLLRAHPKQLMNDESPQSFGGWNHQDQTFVNEGEEEDVYLATFTERLSGGSHQSETGLHPSNFKTSGDTFSDKASFDTGRNSFQNLLHSDDGVTIHEFAVKKQSQKFEVEPSDVTQDVLRTEKVSDLEGETLRLHYEGASSYSGSSVSSSVGDRRDDVETNGQNLEDAVIGNPFVNINEEKYREVAKMTEDGGSVVFDDYDSGGEESVFDLDKRPDTSSHIFSTERELTSYLSENIIAASPKRNMADIFGNNISELDSSREISSDSIFLESLDESAVQVHEDELPPVIFDDARGAHLESGDEPENLERDPEDIIASTSKRPYFSLSGKGSDKFDDPVGKKDQDWGHHSRISSVREADDDDNKAPQRSATVDDSETSGGSSSDGANELNFGKLTGGLRNKGYRHLPYVKSSQGEVSSSVQAAAVETKEYPISDPPKSWSGSEIVGDPYDQKVNNEIQKRTSTTGTYGSSYLGEASDARKSSEDTAKISPFSSAARKETVDSENGDCGTWDKDVEHKKLTGGVEEKSMRIFLGEAPLSKLAVGDPSIKYGFSSRPGQISGSHLQLNCETDTAEGKRSNSRGSLSPYNSEQSGDPKEEVLSQISGTKARYGAGLSRRTKGSPSKADRSSLLNSSRAPEEETREHLKFSSRSSYTDKRSEVKPTYLCKAGGTHDRRANIKSSSRSSMGTGGYRSNPSERATLDDRESSDWPKSGKEAMEKPKPDPPKFSERPFSSTQMSDSLCPSDSSGKPSLEDASRESLLSRAGPVHPKLPDYDSIAAQLELLRANRK